MTRKLTGFSPLVRKKIQDRSDGICEVQAGWRIGGCEAAAAIQQHHRRNRAAGGSRRPETGQPANALHVCLNCHDYICRNPAYALQRGWLVPQHRQPNEIPVLRRGVWVLLGDNGDIQQIPEPAGGKVA